jgi:hypothetical protein
MARDVAVRPSALTDSGEAGGVNIRPSDNLGGLRVLQRRPRPSLDRFEGFIRR